MNVFFTFSQLLRWEYSQGYTEILQNILVQRKAGIKTTDFLCAKLFIDRGNVRNKNQTHATHMRNNKTHIEFVLGITWNETSNFITMQMMMKTIVRNIYSIHTSYVAIIYLSTKYDYSKANMRAKNSPSQKCITLNEKKKKTQNMVISNLTDTYFITFIQFNI